MVVLDFQNSVGNTVANNFKDQYLPDMMFLGSTQLFSVVQISSTIEGTYKFIQISLNQMILEKEALEESELASSGE